MNTITRYILPVATAVLVGLATLGPRQMSMASAAPAPATVLYQADWTTGLDGWSIFPGFNVANGVMTFDGKSDSGAVAPFHTHGLRSFAVEASIQVGTPTQQARPSYDLFVRRPDVHSNSGLYAGYDAVSGEYAATNVADLSWHGARWYYAPGAAFRLDSSFHTYRIEVQGTAYRLEIDGQVMVPWTNVTLAGGDMLGLTFTYVPATVKSFTVYSLPAAPVAAYDTGTLVAHALPQTAIPYRANDAVFRDNARYAADNHLTAATVQGTSRLYGYLQSWQDSQTYIEQSINLHSSLTGAKAAFDLFSGRIQHQAKHPQGYQVIDLSAHPAGDETFAYSYHYLYQGSLSYVVKVLFHRGSYYVGITVDSADPNVAQTAIAYAHMADGFVQTASTQGICVAC